MTSPTQSKVWDRFAREPVLFWGAVGAWAAVIIEGAHPLTQAATAATILWLQRAFSISKRSHEEEVEVSKYVGSVEEQVPLDWKLGNLPTEEG